MTAGRLGEVVTGALVLAAAILFIVYAAGFASGPRVGAGSYALSANFRSVEGVSVGTDVRLGGVKVGTVTALDLDPQTFRARARFSVDDELALPDDTAALVSSEGLLGGSFIELVPGGSPFNIEPGGVIEDTQGAVSLLNLLVRFVGGGADE